MYQIKVVAKVALIVVAGSAVIFANSATISAASSPALIDLGVASEYSLTAVGALTPGATLSLSGTAPFAGAISLGTSSGADVLALSTAGLTHFENNTDTATAVIAAIKSARDGILLLSGTSRNAELGGETYTAGVYDAAANAAMSVSSSITLDGEGNYDSVFIFRTAAALTVAGGIQINFINHAQPSHIFWVAAAAIGIGAGTTIPGNFIAGAALTTGATSTVFGSLLGLDAVTLGASSTIIHNTTDLAPTPTATPSATPTDTATATPTATPTSTPTPTATQVVPIINQPPQNSCGSVISRLSFVSEPGSSSGRLIWTTTGNGRVIYFGDPNLYPLSLAYGASTNQWDGTLQNLKPGIMYVASVHFIADCGRTSELTVFIINTALPAPPPVLSTPTPSLSPVPSVTPTIAAIPTPIPTSKPFVLPTAVPTVAVAPRHKARSAISPFVLVSKPVGATQPMSPLLNTFNFSMSKSALHIILRNLAPGQNVSVVMRGLK